MELCYSPFSVEEGLRRSLREPPATMLVLPGMILGEVYEAIAAESRHSNANEWQSVLIRVTAQPYIRCDRRRGGYTLGTSICSGLDEYSGDSASGPREFETLRFSSFLYWRCSHK